VLKQGNRALLRALLERI